MEMRAADMKEASDKYALLFIFYYKHTAISHQGGSRYQQRLHGFNFVDVDHSDGCIKSDLPKVEKLNNFKINIHLWKKVRRFQGFEVAVMIIGC